MPAKPWPHPPQQEQREMPWSHSTVVNQYAQPHTDDFKHNQP
jgi:hypothetical protein